MEQNLALIVNRIKNQRYISGYQSSSIIGAGGVIYDPCNERLLVVLGKEKWSLPKGHKEEGEEPYQTAIREIEEETSLKVDLNQQSKSRRILKCIYYFILFENGTKLNLTPIDTNEVIAIKWLTKEELLKLSCNKQLRYFIRKWSFMIDYIKIR